MCHNRAIATIVELSVAIWMSSSCQLMANYIHVKRVVHVSGEDEPTPYLLLEPSHVLDEDTHPLIVYLYGAGGSIEDYNLARTSYDELRCISSERGYYILVPELGQSHWMNRRAQRILDAIIAHAVANYPVDTKRVHLMGTSMGGGSALAYAVVRPKQVRSVCAICPMTDFVQWVKENRVYLDSVAAAYNGSPAKAKKTWEQTSAMKNLDAFKNIPVFLIHGSDDSIVLPGHSQRLALSLRKKGYEVVFHEVTGAGHTDKVVEPFQKDIIDFFDKYGQ